jgi:hypothetical protein
MKRLRRILITGMLGRGKSYLTKQIVLQSAAAGEAVLVMDYFGEFLKYSSDFIYVFTEVERLEFFLDLVEDVAKQWPKTLVVFDEAHQYTRTTEISKELQDKFVRLLRRSRHFNLEFILVSQAIVDIPPVIRRLVEEFWYFQTCEISDLEYIRKKWGDQTVEAIRGLPDRSFVKLFSWGRF